MKTVKINGTYVLESAAAMTAQFDANRAAAAAARTAKTERTYPKTETGDSMTDRVLELARHATNGYLLWERLNNFAARNAEMRDRSFVEDILQTARLSVWQSITVDGLTDDDDIRRAAFTAIRAMIGNEYHRAEFERKYSADYGKIGGGGHVTAPTDRAACELIKCAVFVARERMTDTQREIFELFWQDSAVIDRANMDGATAKEKTAALCLTAAEIADRRAVKTPTVWQALYKAFSAVAVAMLEIDGATAARLIDGATAARLDKQAKNGAVTAAAIKYGIIDK